MSDLGIIGVESAIAFQAHTGAPLIYAGVQGALTTLRAPDQGRRANFRCLRAGDEYHVIGGKDLTEGSELPPSLRLDARGFWSFRWPVAAGDRAIQINVKQAANLSPRPSMIIRANAEIGILADVSGVAEAGAGWVTIGPLAVSPNADGALQVELWNNLDTMVFATPCYFDDRRAS